MEFLGLEIDSVQMKYYVPAKKSDDICRLLCDILSLKKVHVKVLAKLCGKLQFCFRAFGMALLSNFCLVHLIFLISKASLWNSMIVLTEAAKKGLSYLFQNWELLNGFPIRASLSASPLHFRLVSDPSDIGNCVYEVKEHENTVLHKRLFSVRKLRVRQHTENYLLFMTFIFLIKPKLLLILMLFISLTMQIVK